MRVRRLAALITVLGVTGATSACANGLGGPATDERDIPALAAAVSGDGWDFDGDGHQEFVAEGTNSPLLRVFRGTADGPGARPRKLSAADLDVPEKHLKSFGEHASGDVNGDGYDDLVSCVSYYRLDELSRGYHWDRVGVVLGSEQGLTHWVPMGPERRGRDGCLAPTLADVDHDGYDDTVHVWDDRVRWARGGEDIDAETDWGWRTIAKPTTVDGVIHRDYDHLMLGDVDGDDRVDLTYTSNGIATPEGEVAGGGGIWVRRGTEDGFGEPDRWVDESGAGTPRIGDVDGDGFDDLVTYEYERIRVRHGSEDGLAPPERAATLLDTTAAWARRGMDGLRFPRSMDAGMDDFAVVDLDGDGASDVVASAMSGGSPAPGKLVVLPGGKRDSRPSPYAIGQRDAFVELGTVGKMGVRARDLTSRKGTELVAAFEAGEQRYGFFFDRADIERRSAAEKRPEPAAEAARPWDFDGDEKGSVVIGAPKAERPRFGDPPGVVVMFDPTSDASPPEGERLESGDRRYERFGQDVTSGDFDSDGHADLAVCQRGGVTLMFGSGDGLGRPFDAPLGCRAAEAADVDRDGFDDLVLARSGRVVWVRGGPGLRSPAGWQARPITDEGAYQMALGDVNGDGHLDLAYDDGYVKLAFGSADGLTPRVRDLGEVSSFGLALGDVNGDGNDDLVVASHDDEVLVWPGSGNGPQPDPATRMTAPDLGLSVSGSESASSVAVEDIDGDGYAETAIGVPDAESGGQDGAGVVVVAPGGRDGPSPADAVVLSQGSVSRSGDPERGDAFGERVEYRDLLPDPGPELFVGSPGEDDGDGKVQLISAKGEVRQYRPEDAGIDPKGARLGE